MNPDNEQSLNQAPQPSQPQVPQQPTVTPPQGSDPGKTLAIVGLVLGFIGLSLIGLILSIVSKKKSSKAGFKNTVALIGIILNSIFIFLTIVVIIPITLISYNAVQNRSRDLATYTELNQLNKAVVSYISEKSTKPSDLAAVASAANLDQSYLTDHDGKAYTLTWKPDDCSSLTTCTAYTLSADSARRMGEKVSITYDALTGETTYVNNPTSNASE